MHSQNNEEELILNHFSQVAPKFKRLLDVGAFDGQTFSNSLALIERGWGGMLVEPNPASFRSLARLHLKQSQREGEDNVKLVNALLTPGLEQGLTTFWTTDDAVSTAVSDFKEVWGRVVNYQPIYLPRMPAKVFAEWAGDQFDFVNLDTEGLTLELAVDLIDTPCFRHATLACVEHSGAGRVYRDELTQLFQRGGWRVTGETTENLLFAR